MRHRKVWLAVVSVCLLLGLGAWWHSDQRSESAPVATVTVGHRVPPPPFTPALVEIVDHPVIAAAAGLFSSDSAAEDLEIVALILADYRKALGGNPVGENEEITACLLGGNRLGLRFFPPSHRALDAAGRLCDRWGTPLFFHALSGRRLTLFSAGPDRDRDTADDVVLTLGAE